MNKDHILDTIHMLDEEKLDIRTVTLGISLFDCAGSIDKIYDKICRNAKDLVKKANKIGAKYGVHIVNKRIALTPIALVASDFKEKDLLTLAKKIDQAGKEVGVDFVGGYSALVHKSMTETDQRLIASIPQVLSETDLLCSSINVGSTRSGINMDAVALMGRIIKETAYATRARDSIGCAKLVVFCNAVEDNPFMAGAFHGPSLGDVSLSVGISGPGTVKYALEKMRGKPFQYLAEAIKKTSFKMTRLGELIGKELAKDLGIDLGIIDLSLAPTPAIGDSVARVLEEMGLSQVGMHGSTACLAMLNDQIKKGGLMASSHVGGLSGAFIPVSEDEGMISAVGSGSLTMDKLEAMTSVCSVGLDMIALAGDTPASTIAAIISDEAAIGMINGKTTAVRVIPVYGKKLGEEVHFGGLLGFAPIMKIHEGSSEDLLARGGFIPPPITSFKN